MTRTAAIQTGNPVSTARFDLSEVVAMAMTIVIALGAFAWSFAALTELSVMAGISPRLAWAGPIFVDGAIVQAAVALVSLQRRASQGVPIPQATTVFFWAELAVAELISIVGNGLHAAESGQRLLPATIAAGVAAAAPLFGLAATHGLTALIQVPRLPEPAARPVDAVSTRLDSEVTAVDTEWTPVDTDRKALDSGLTPVDSDPTAERDAEILRLREAGGSFRSIGAAVGLSHSRVAQILATAEADDGDAEVLSFVR